MPQIQLADFKSFTVEKPVVDVTDSDVDDAIKRIADQSRPYTAKGEGAKAENGDRVTISFKGTIDGVPFDGGTGEGIQVVIGAGQFIPGFEEQLIGIGASETRTLKVSFPKNYANEKLAGQPAEFETTATADRGARRDQDRRRVRQDAGPRIARQAEGSRARASGRPNSPAPPVSASSARCSTVSTRATNSRRRRR